MALKPEGIAWQICWLMLA